MQYEEKKRLQIYEKAKAKMKTASQYADYIYIRDLLCSIPGYRDADKLARDYDQKAQTAQNEAIYLNAISLLKKSKKHADFISAEKAFRKIPGYKDADELASKCAKRAEKAKTEAVYQYSLDLISKACKLLITYDEIFESDQYSSILPDEWEERLNLSINSASEAKQRLQEISNYKDTESLIQQATSLIQKAEKMLLEIPTKQKESFAEKKTNFPYFIIPIVIIVLSLFIGIYLIRSNNSSGNNTLSSASISTPSNIITHQSATSKGEFEYSKLEFGHKETSVNDKERINSKTSLSQKKSDESTTNSNVVYESSSFSELPETESNLEKELVPLPEEQIMYNQFLALCLDDHYSDNQYYIDLNGDGLKELMMRDDGPGYVMSVYYWNNQKIDKKSGMIGFYPFGNALCLDFSLVRGKDADYYLYFEELNRRDPYWGFYNFNRDESCIMKIDESDESKLKYYTTGKKDVSGNVTESYMEDFYSYLNSCGFAVDASCTFMKCEPRDAANELWALAGDLNSGFSCTRDRIGCVSTITATLNLRSEPTTNGRIIVQIPPGSLVSIDTYATDVVDKWFFVDVTVNGKRYSGYVSKEYILYRNVYGI